MQNSKIVRALSLAALPALITPLAQAAEFDWAKYKGTTIASGL